MHYSTPDCSTRALAATSLSTLLERWRGKRALLVSPPGNNGDHLILLGTLALLDRLDVELVRRGSQADVILLNGGATMTEFWPGGFQRLYDYGRRFARTPLIVLPSSFWFPNTDLTPLVKMRKAETMLIAREQDSFNRLSQTQLRSPIVVHLSHDAAFELANSRFLDDLRATTTSRHNLVIDREDREAATAKHVTTGFVPLTPWREPGRYMRHVVRPSIRQLLRTIGATPQAQNDAFRESTERTKQLLRFIGDDIKEASLSTLNADVSRPDLFSFDSFCRLIADASTVISTRLHAAILAALLSKRTIIVGQSYGKLEGIYKLSIEGKMPNVTLVADPASSTSTVPLHT